MTDEYKPTAWDAAIDFVLGWEGGYVNDLDDPGGETKYGISKRAYPALDIAALTQEQALEIYKRDYWNPIAGDELPPKVALAVFDCAVNQGAGKAARLLQVCLGVVVDGWIGPKTVGAAHKADQAALLTQYLARRAMEYARIITENQRLRKFGLGWMRRLFMLADLVLEDEVDPVG